MDPGTTQLTDAALVQSALGDDGEAFGHLYRRFYPRLVRLIVRKTGDRLLAEDVAQEALLRAFDKLDTFDRARPLWPWLKVIATNLAVDAGRKRSREVEWEPQDAAGMPAKELPSCEEGMVLAQVLANLPDRQRVAVSLRYLQDWESSEVASFLGLSIPAYEQLLFRARKRLRLEYSRISKGALGVFGAPGRWLRREAAHLAARFPGVRRALDATSHLGPVTWAQAAAGGLAFLIALPALPVVTERPRGPAAAVAALAGNGDRGSVRTEVSGGAGRGAGGRAPRSAASPPSAASPAPGKPGGPEAGTPHLKKITEPNHDVRDPEDARIVSVAFAPEDAKRAFAIGSAPCPFGACRPVLFTSGDGGATWQRLPAAGFSGHALVVPPGSDGTRLFAMAPSGLQVSANGGRSFTMAAPTGAAPLTGSVAVSPAFDRGDPIMLIGAQTLLRYDDSTATIQPEPSTVLNGPFEPVFAPAYPADPRFLMGGLRVDRGGVQSTVFTCSKAMCTWTRLPRGTGTPRLRLRPDYRASDVAYAFTDNHVYRSSDVWGFTVVETPWPDDSRIRDLALIGAGDTMFATVDSIGGAGGEGLYRSDDGGLTWSRVRSPLFADGASAIAVGEGRMIVALPGAGLACSDDGGVRWSRRC